MTIAINRRHLILGGMMGAGALAIPGFANAFALLQASGFTHSVASGEPSATSLLLWTRYVPTDRGAARVKVELSETPDFARIAGGAEIVTGPWRDHTAKITVAGLRPGTRYHYRFVAPDGGFSPVGRAKTLPDGNAERFNIAIFSCSNLGFGYFNAYGHAAARDDIDLAVHLGDYLYEYGPDNYPNRQQTVGGRIPQPEREMVSLADYRLRFASYRADADLQALHAAHPMVALWDDHESTNDSWEGGAQNHQPDEGEWAIRRAASIQAYYEWMPVSEEPWKAYDIAGLATLFRTETRLLGRSRPPELTEIMAGAGDPAQALAAFRDGPWRDPAMTMMGTTQEAWLDGAIRASVKSGARWQVVGFGTIMGETRTPASAADWLAKDAPPFVRGFVQRGVAASRVGLPLNFDAWGGYPAARARFLSGAQGAEANLIVIAGDSHNGWAFDLAQDGRAAGVEFAGQAVTSPGFESALGVDPKIVARALVETNPELKWADTSHRGYMALSLTPERATNDWVFVDGIRTRGTGARIGHRATVLRGRNRMG